MKISLSSALVHVTSMAFTPILPYPATDYDTIHTALFNSEDVLMQNQEHGALWSKE